MPGKIFWSVSFFSVGQNVYSVPQNKGEFTINNFFYCCEGLIFTHPLVYQFLCGPKHMGTPVNGPQKSDSKNYWRFLPKSTRHANYSKHF